MIRPTVWACLFHDRPQPGCESCDKLSRPRQPIHPPCPRCGWRMGGVDSWNGRACKCGKTAAPYPDFEALDAEEWRPHLELGIEQALKRRGVTT